jgi:fatty acid amide hydrolase 2
MWWESNNTIYGRTNNPYDSRRIVGGSSGGEGALISSAGSVFGIGSDTGGSIRTPAAFTGIFGHKPTGNIVSSQGLFPASYDYQKTMSTAGPMCRYAVDLLPMLSVLAGSGAGKLLTLDKTVDFKQLKIFYMDEIQSSSLPPKVDFEMKNATHKVIKYFEEKYNVLSYKLDLTNFHWALPIWMNDMHSPNAPPFAQEITDFKGEVNPYSELCRWLIGKSDHTFPAIGLVLFEKLLSKSSSNDSSRFLVHLREQLSQQFETLLGDNGIFLFPSHPTLTPFHNQPCWTPFNFMYTGVFNSLALPVTCCPMGLSRNGTPLSVQVVGALNRDHLTIAVAQELERAFGGWIPPWS